MNTKLDPEELAAKHHRYYARRESYAAAIREHSQPLADKLDAVTRERDELREALEMISTASSRGFGIDYVNGLCRSVLAKYPRTNEANDQGGM